MTRRTWAVSRDSVRSQNHTPPGKAPVSARSMPTSRASLVFPAPPDPSTVTTRAPPLSSPNSRVRSCTRPTNRPVSGRRLVGLGPWGDGS